MSADGDVSEGWRWWSMNGDSSTSDAPTTPDDGQQQSLEQLRTVVDNSPIVLVAFDCAGTITLAEGWDLPTFGSSRSGWLGLGLRDVEATSPAGAAAIARALTGEPCDLTVAFRGRHFDFRFRPQRDRRGATTGVLAIGTDVTSRVAAAEQSDEQESRWQSLVSRSADVAIIIDAHTTLISYVSPAVTRLFGWEPAELIGRTGRSLIHSDDTHLLVDALRQVRADPGSHPTVEFRLACADGSFRWVEETYSDMSDVPGVHGLVANIRDINDRRAAENAVRASENRYRIFAETAQEGIWAVDHTGHTLFANQKLAELLGRQLADIYALPSHEILTNMTRDEVLDVHRRRGTNGTAIVERVQVHPDASRRILRFSIASLVEDGRPLGSLSMITDMTAARAAEDELRRRAFHDPLTGIANRTLLLEVLTSALAPAESTTPGGVAVLVADLDQFKLINDSFGHAAGDELLLEVARRWDKLLSPTDCLARLGGDEFAVVCGGFDAAAAGDVANRLLNALERPVRLAGRTVAVSASIGIAVTGAGVETDAATMLRYGDAAMYAAKAQGRGRTVVFTPSLADRARNRLELFNDLKLALANDDLRLAYQPLVELATGKMLGVEALCRWTHATRGVVTPDEFIQAAEETGLIEELDGWVLNRACREAADLRAAGVLAPDAYVAVNVSAGHLAQPGFQEQVMSALHAAGLPAEALVLEVTESAVMGDPDAARAVLERLQSWGIHASIDDFGTGYSSLGYLKRLPVTSLKIDRSFVQHINENADDRAIVSAVIELARALNLTTTAEGIETADDLQLLQQLGCRAGQGWLWSPAVSPMQLAELVSGLPLGRFPVDQLLVAAAPAGLPGPRRASPGVPLAG